MPRKAIQVPRDKLWMFDIPSKSNPGQGWTYGTVVENPKKILFLAGCVPLNEKGELVGRGDIKAQITQVMRNIETVLKAGGATFRDVVSIRTYVTDLEAYVKVNKWRCKQWPKFWGNKLGDQKAPPNTLVEIKRLGGKEFMIEIEAFAAV